MLGNSWKTTLIGYLLIAIDFIKLAHDSIKAGGLPADTDGWFIFVLFLIGGVIGILSKDYDKSNAPAPVAIAKDVPPTT